METFAMEKGTFFFKLSHVIQTYSKKTAKIVSRSDVLISA
jgi:hypothetical protein